MSTTDPTGDRGGGGGGGGLASITPTDDNVTPVTSSTGVAVSPASHHQQHPPPSPLSGCYLLVVLPEPHTAQHKDLILNRLAKGFLSWDKDSCHVDLEKELQALVAQAPEGEEARNGERLIQYATENLVTEVLIHPQTNTLLQCMRNLLASFTKHRHIIHAGYTFSGNGSWILQDGTFSLADFLDAFSEHEVQRVLRAYENSVTVDINCAGVGEWSTSRLSKEACTRSCRVRLNPDDVLTAGVPAITSFTSYVGQYLVSQTLDQLMEPSDVVGNIRFSHPTLYVFPGGQGDAALFGINGFNMLVDGGFARKACFWDFARHLDRLDAVLMTRINNSNVGGMSSVLRKKREMHVYPQIGHFFCNLIERKSLNSPDGDKDLDPLILNLTDIGHEMMVDLRHINLRAHPCYRDPNPINLYHKVGHGTLDMYVLSPSKDSREVREFLSKWHASDSKLFSGSYRKDSNNLTFPIQNLASICALLVWQPANPEDTITRILFPGSTPQHKIFEGIERLKHLEFLKHPVCTAKSISPSTSLLTLKDKPTTKQKLGLIEESRKASDAKKERRELLDSKLSKASDDSVGKATPQGTPVNQPPKVQPPKIDVKTKKVIENKKIETESKKIEKDLKEHKKEPVKKPDAAKTEKDSEVKKVEGYKIKVDNERAALSKEPKAKPEPKKKETKESKPAKTSRAEPVTKAAMRIGDKKQKSPADKRDSMKASPTTPKKSMNGAATKVELSRATSRPITKPSAKTLTSTMPAKSAKDANNRKVVEQKNIEIASAESAAAPASAKAPPKQKAAERKPIGRRPKPISPIKARLPISPTKSTRSTPTTSVKSDKDGIIRKIKGDRGTADSSTVSTPSGIEIDSMTKLADKCLTEKSEDMSLDSIESKVLADLKEEREVVEEIEAVLQKAERIEGARRDDHLEGDDDITAEATDKKEDDMTEDDVTAEIEEIPKKESSRKTSHELTEEDEYLIIEKEEIYIEDSVQSGEVEEKHAPGAAVDDEEAKTRLDAVPTKEEEEEEEEDDEGGEQEEAEVSEEKEKADIPEKQLGLVEGKLKEAEEPEKPASSDQVLEEQMKNIIASTAEMLQKTEDKDDSGKKDSEDITKEPSSLSPDKFDSSEKKTTDTDVKPETDQKDRQVPEKLEESHERMSTLESGATTTAPTLPEDERIPLDEIKEVVDEKCLADQETKPDGEIKAPEPLAAQIQPEAKPDAKAFEVHPPLHGIQREIVKTPDEVADLPVHEEVDPTLYRMEHFEKGKEEKPVQQPPAPQKELKEPEIPAAKEPKGVFSFFGKVADKFEKGIDKLTGKSRRDSEKDIDEKSSSKSGSPKEVKAQSIAFPGSATAEEITAGLTKVAEASELPETFEEGIPDLTQVKVAAIKDTATFLADEIADLKKTSPPHKEPSDSKGETAMAELVSEAPQASEPVFETCHVKEKIDKITADELEGEDDVEEVEALLAEASKKFKDVKDSLHDSLESLEERLAEQELARAELHAISKDFVKDTLSEVVEKLEDMKPKDLDELVEKKEHDEAEEAPGEEEEEEEDLDEAVVTKDLKGAVRDVGEVLAGSAGILIDDKPKDVIEIVKKVAEVLKKDDFLSHDVLFDPDAPEAKEDEKSSPKVSTEAAIIPKKVEATEELPSQEEIAESRGSRRESIVSAQKPTAAGESPKDSASKAPTPTPSPTKDAVQEKMEAMKICAEFLDEEPILPRQKRSADEDPAKKDVVEAGIEAVCVKQKVDKPTRVEGEADDESKEQSIVFDRKVSPVTAEVVIVTPDLSPTSPALPSDKIHTEGAQAQPEVSDVSQLLPHDILNALKSNEPLEQLIEQLVYTKKVKITREIVEFIIIVRKISRYDVIRIIERIILKKGSPPDSVVTDLRVLTDDVIPTEKREDVENHIIKEYVTNNKKITMKVIDEISNQKGITRRILVTIIIEIIIKKNIQREGLLDLSEKELSELDLDEPEAEEQDKLSEASEISGIEDEAQDIASSDKYSAVRTFIENEVIAKGKKITPQLIDDVCVAKLVPRRVFIEIIEKIMVERKIPRSSMVDISEKEMSELLASEKEHAKLEEDEDGDADQSGSSTPDRGQEIAAYISDEFIAKKKKITLQNFKDICSRNDVSVQMLWNLIDNVIEKQKLDRAVVMDISENELSDLLTVEEEEMTREDAAEVSAPASNRAEIESSIVEEFVSKNRRITPYIFEDICLRYKVPRRIIIEIIETIIVKRNLQRNSILDITDTELTELLDVVEAQDEEEAEGLAKSPAKGQEPQDDADEDKLVDGFVSISSKDDVKVEDVLRKKSVTPVVGKESEKDVDDFEAVEQEYKIHGLSLTPDKELPLTSQMISDEKMLDEVEDVVQDHSSDVVEAKEKIVGTALKPASPTKAEEKPLDVSEHSEALDTTEKYLVEAKEKTESAEVSKSKPVSPSSDTKSSESPIEKDALGASDEISVQESAVTSSAPGGLEGEAKPVQSDVTSPKPSEVATSPELPDNDAKIGTAAVRKPSTAGHQEEQEETRQDRSEEESTKATSRAGSLSPKDEKSSKDDSLNEETPLSSSTVHRMVVTASSEDGGHEMEVCPSGSITFTPEDSLKSSPIKTTPDQDSLRLDKESVHSGISTPERDSISDKSATVTKDGEKITPEDSLDKSPSVTRGSQDLEDSLDKSDLTKLKETKGAERPSEEREDAAVRHVSEAIDEKLEGDADTKVTNLVESTDVSEPDSEKVTSEKPDEVKKDSGSPVSEKSVKSHEGSPTIEAVGATETGASQLEPSKLREEKPVEKTDVTEKPRSLASEIQSAIEQKTGTDVSGVTVEPIVQTKSPSPSKESESDEIHDRVKRSSVFDSEPTELKLDTKHVDEPESKLPSKGSTPPTGDQHKDGEVLRKLSSHDISPSDIDKSRSPSVSSDVKHAVDDHEEDTIPELPEVSKSLESAKSEDKLVTPVEGLHDKKPEDAVHSTASNGKSEPGTESLESAISPSVESRKASMVDSKVLTDKQDEIVSKDLLAESEVSRKDSIAEKHEDSMTASRSPSITTEAHDEREKISRSRSPSIVGSEHDQSEKVDSVSSIVSAEKQSGIEDTETSKLSTVVSEKLDGKSPISPTIAHEKEDEKESLAGSKSPSIAGEKDLTDRSRSPSVVAEKQDEKAAIDGSKSPSVPSEKEDERESIERSRSPSVTTGKQDEKETIDRSKSPSIAGDKRDEKESVDRSKSPSIASEKGDEKESIERSRSASLVPEKQDVKDSGDRSKSPSVVSEKDEKESIERSRSPSVATEKPDEKGSIDRSRSPSIAGERLDEKAPIDDSKSPSVASEKGEEKESTDRSRSPSVAVEKQGEKETIDRSKSPSVTSEKEEAKESMERSRSTSLASERHDEKEPEDRSRSPSMTAEKADAKEAIDRSKSPSVASEKDEKEPVDRSRSASVATEKHDEKERPDGSKSPSIASEKGEEKEPIDRSRSPSVAVEKQGEKEPIDRSKSPSVTSEKGDEKETVDRSRSASIATEKQDTKESIDRSKSPSIASEKDEKEPIDRSRSPSVAADKKDEKEPADRSGSVSPALEKQVEIEPIDQSRSPSIAPEKQDEKGSSDRSKSPSVASEKGEEKEIIDRSRSASLALEKPDELQPIASSKSPSLASEKGEEKEIIDRSRSASLAPEKPGELQPAIDTSKSPSVAGDVADEKESVGRSRSPSIVVDKPDGKEERPAGSKSPSTSPAKEDTKEPLGRSRSSSIADDKPSEKASVDHSRSPSIAAEKPEEKPFDVSTSPSTGVEKPVEKETIDGSKSPSPASDKQEKTEVTDRSRSPSIAGEKQDEKESSERSRTASIVPEQPESIDRSKSPSIAGEKPDELELSDRLRSPSITGSKQEIAESADRSKSPSIAGDKREGDEIPRSRSSSVASGKPDAKDSIDGSKSPSIAGEKHDEKESFERSRSTSVVSARLEEKESIDHSRSASIAGEKQEEIESIGRSRSASVAVGKPDDKEAIARSRSASIAFGHEEQELTDRSRSGSIAGEKKILDRSRSSSVVVEKQEEEELLDRSRSGSVAVETKDEKESEAKESITEGSITGEKTSEKTSADASRSASLSPQEQIGTEPADRSRSSSTVGVAPKETESTVHSRSPSIADGKKDAEQLIEHSRSPSLVSTILDKVDSILRPESLAAVDGKQGEKDSPASSKTVDSEEPTELVGGEKSPKDAAEAVSPSPSVTSEQQDTNESVYGSRSPSIASRKLSSSHVITDEKIDKADEPIDLSSASLEGKMNGVDACKRPSIVDDKCLDSRKESVASIVTAQDSKLDASDAVQAMQKLAETIADKSLATCDIKDVETPRDDGTRSHSLSEAGEKSPKSRSPTASLIDDEVPGVLKPSDQATIAKEDASRKSSIADISLDKLDPLPSDSKKFCTTELEGAQKRGSVEIPKDIAGRFAEDYHTTSDKINEIKTYIVNKYIDKKERISPQTVEDIVSLYSISRHIILELIEAIIIEKNVPRDVIVSFPKNDETEVSPIVFEDDHVDVIDIPTAKQQEIENRIYQEFVTKRSKITSLVINELAAVTFISRHIIIMIIQKMVRDEKGLTPDMLEDGILDESTTEYVQSEAAREQGHESSAPRDERIESDLRSESTDVLSHSEAIVEDQAKIPDSKWMEVETYVMEECVKKRIKINLLVFEQIIMRTGVPRSVLLSVIDKIILSGKIPRTEMLDDAIYDEVETVSDRGSASEEKAFREATISKDRVTELSGKSTPDPRSSGYSTPEVRHYDDKFGKSMAYSHDYESPFHKAFVGGMTEIRTTHITTLSGKSTPDYTARGETPEESLSESISQAKFDEKFEGVESSEKSTSAVLTTEAAATTFTTTVHTVTEPIKTSHLKDDMVTRETASVEGEAAKKDAAASKGDRSAGSDEGEPEIVKKIITREIIEETGPVTEITIHKREIVEELPEAGIKTIESSSTDHDGDGGEVHKISRIVRETSSPETIEIVTVKTIETIVTDDTSPETIKSKLGSLDGTQDLSVTEHTVGDVKTVTTTVTMTSEPQTVEEIVEKSGSKSVEKIEDESHTTTQIISKVTYSAPLDSQQTEKLIQDLKEAATSSPTTTTSSVSQSRTVEDSSERVEKSKSVSQTISERIGIEKLDHPVSPVIKDLISGQRSFTGRTSPDVAPAKEAQQGGSTLPSAPDVPGSPFSRDSGLAHAQLSGRSTPDKRGASRSRTATPEGMRSNEVIRTTITTTRTMSDEGDIITTTMEITETTNEKGETIILAEKTDVKVEDRIIPGDMSKSTLASGFEALKAPVDSTGEADVDQVSPRSDHSSVQSRAGTHIWGSSEERYTYSDDDVPGSPLSTTSQVGYSPQSTYALDDHTFDKDPSRKSMEFSVADMSASFYGELPDLPPRVTTIKTTHLDGSGTEAGGTSEPIESDFSFKKFTVAKEFAGVSRDAKSEGKKYIDDADLDFEKALTEHKESKSEKEISGVVGSSSSHGSSSQPQSGDKKPEPKSDSKKDPLAGWDSPLGLPSPKPPRKFNLRTVARPTNNVVDESPDSINFDPINDWGEPLRLPSPAPVVDEGSNKGAPSTPKKERKQPKKILSENIKNRKRSESPAKNEKKAKDAKAKIQPVYMDLTYVPHHGNSYYTSVEFFKRVRARYYVFSGTEPSREVYDALLDAKKTWEDKDLEVTMIPTYDTDTLGYWVADNEEALAANHIDLSPSASRCTINLQDHETSCSAYRLEF